jgi:hypothetical protein
MRTLNFSESLGLVEPTEETLTNVSHELKIALWNNICEFTGPDPDDRFSWYPGFQFPSIVKSIADVCGVSHNDALRMSSRNFWDVFNPWFIKLQGSRVYDCIHYVASNIDDEELKLYFMEKLNETLQKKSSPCRFIAGQLTPITGQAFIDTVNNAASTSSKKVNDDMKKALSCLYQQKFVDACTYAERALEACVKTF